MAMSSSEKEAKTAILNRQLDRLTRRLAALYARSRRYSWSRLALVLTGSLVTFLLFRLDAAWPGWLSLVGFIAAFAAVAACHRRVTASLTRHRIWKRIKRTHLARLTLDWPHIPEPPAFPADAAHPFQHDLNLTGPRSILHLIDTAMSQGGSARLLNWLVQPDPETTRSRQALVRDLVGLSTFRDRLSLNGALVLEDPEERWDGEQLLDWLDAHTAPASLKPYLILLAILAALNFILFGLYTMQGIPAVWTVSFLTYLGLYFFRYRSFKPLFEEAAHLEKTLTRFRAVLLYLETYRYGRHPHLARLCEPFWKATPRPSAHLKKIARIAAAASTQRSELIWFLFNMTVPWDLYFTHRLNRCKQDVRAHLPRWLQAWHTLEAACSLASFADLNPGYAFPELVDEAAPPFEGCDLGHPLLPDDGKVCNDFAVATLGEIALITGSNMSGKSTFLRTLGVNLCLAYAGGPVNASTLKIRPFRLFTCLNVSDSVNDGISYFYAEVRRLKALLNALHAEHPFPLFFLIDEIFRGTNNRERLQGSRAYVRTLTGGYGIGAISTHDLELITLEAEVAGIHNYHFREDVAGRRMVFDYRLHPGPCPTTNALKIMQMEGLPVDPGGASAR